MLILPNMVIIGFDPSPSSHGKSNHGKSSNSKNVTLFAMKWKVIWNPPKFSSHHLPKSGKSALPDPKCWTETNANNLSEKWTSK